MDDWLGSHKYTADYGTLTTQILDLFKRELVSYKHAFCVSSNLIYCLRWLIITPC